jgi:hypothetical protein
VRDYVKDRLLNESLSVPTKLLDDDVTLITTDDRDTISRERLQEAFHNAMNLFWDSFGDIMEEQLEQVPSTVSSIEDFIVRTCRVVLTQDDVSWGGMVAVTAFITKVALRYTAREMSHAVSPVIEQIAFDANEKLAPFIQEGGGWAVFGRAFRTKQPSWLRRTITAIAALVQAYL